MNSISGTLSSWPSRFLRMRSTRRMSQLWCCLIVAQKAASRLASGYWQERYAYYFPNASFSVAAKRRPASASQRSQISFFIGRRLPNLPRRHGGTETRRKLGGKTKSKAKAKPRTCQNLNRREEPESSLFLRGCLRAYAQRLNGRR